MVGHPGQRTGCGSCQAVKHVMQIIGDLIIYTRKETKFKRS